MPVHVSQHIPRPSLTREAPRCQRHSTLRGLFFENQKPSNMRVQVNKSTESVTDQTRKMRQSSLTRSVGKDSARSPPATVFLKASDTGHCKCLSHIACLCYPFVFASLAHHKVLPVSTCVQFVCSHSSLSIPQRWLDRLRVSSRPQTVAPICLSMNVCSLLHLFEVSVLPPLQGLFLGNRGVLFQVADFHHLAVVHRDEHPQPTIIFNLLRS